MFLLNTPARLLVLVFLITSMLSIGLQAGIADLRTLSSSRRALLRALAANFVMVPLAGIAIALLLPLGPGARGALVLLACTPGGVSALQFTSKVRGGTILAGAIPALLCVLAVPLSPAMLRLLLPAGENIQVAYGRTLGYIALVIVSPLIVGMLVHARAPLVAAKLSRAMALLSVVAFVAVMIVTKAMRKEALASIGATAIGAMGLFLMASMAIGWVLGGPAREGRWLLATATSMRNAALCLALAQNSPRGEALMAPLIAFSLLMVPPNMLLTVGNLLATRMSAAKAKARAQSSGAVRKGQPS